MHVGLLTGMLFDTWLTPVEYNFNFFKNVQQVSLYGCMYAWLPEENADYD